MLRLDGAVPNSADVHAEQHGAELRTLGTGYVRRQRPPGGLGAVESHDDD